MASEDVTTDVDCEPTTSCLHAEVIAEPDERSMSPAKIIPPVDLYEESYQMFIPGSAPTVLQPLVCSETGNILGFEEQWNISAEISADARHSMSMNRAPDPEAYLSAVGKRGNLPFLPGGFENEIDEALKRSEAVCTDEEETFLSFDDLLTTPPGFDLPVDLPEFDETPATSAKSDAMPPGIADNSTLLDHLLPKDLSMESDGTVVEKMRFKFRNVLLSDAQEDAVGEEAAAKETDTTKPEDDSENLLAKSDASDTTGFTHAKFLDNDKVARYFDEKVRPIMAKTYPFELDMFQKQAIVSMEAGDSVFVAAHTSAGKTVCAEYAIALGKIHKTRVIYTSPIKALSNQKFREFKLAFGDVGLITGDVQLNTDAFCLIMTTEILRSMLYNGSEVIRELEWVIFDEVHYINDEERGHVWEEVLIMLPSHVSIVMLSATVPNCVEFADWVGRIKQRQITVIQTLKRPVPLEHFVYTGHDGKSREELFLIMNKDGQWLGNGYNNALQAKSKIVRLPDPHLQQAVNKSNQRSQHGGKGSSKFQNYQMQAAMRVASEQAPKKSNYAIDRSAYSNLTAFLKARNCLPVVVFVFSRKRCDDNADMMQNTDLTTQSEKAEIVRFFNRCIDRLQGSDKMLPQVVQMKGLCERGFAVHHSGILPILKEVVELLFQRGLVKVLFATETFAMGVNMPARTVVFDDIEKYDGLNKRPLNPTEYTQMAGRAGRRGLDDTGIVIILIKKTMPPVTAFTQLLMGKAVSLESRFRVTYAMLLKLLRVEQFRIEDMLQRSYVERDALRLVVDRKRRINDLQDEIKALPSDDCEQCLKPCPGHDSTSLEQLYFDLRTYFDQLSGLFYELMDVLLQKLLVKGRVLLINYPPLGLMGRVAVVLDTKKDEHGRYILILFMPADESRRDLEDVDIKAFSALSEDERRMQIEKQFIQYTATHGLFHVTEPRRNERSYRVIGDFKPEWIQAICKQSVKNVDVDTIIKENSMRGRTARPRSPDRSITRVVAELDGFAEKWAISGPPISQFGVDIKPKEVNMYVAVQHICELQTKLQNRANYPCLSCPLFENHLSHMMHRSDLQGKLDMLVHKTSYLVLDDEYKNRLRVLRALDYVDSTNMIGLKGKIACEISHLEVLITELMLENRFEGKTCAELAAMLSPLTCQFTYAGSRERDMTMEFKHQVNVVLRHEVISAAQRIDNMQIACNVHSSFILEELRFGLMDVVYEWASGTPFSDIMNLTDCQEGLIVRCIQRLDEVCKDVRNAARIIGDSALYERMEETSTMIKRDIVFAASLYTVDA